MIAGSFHGENRLIAKRRPEVRIDARHLCDLSAGQYNCHAIQRFRFRFLDARDARMRIWTAQNCDMQHIRHLDITDVQRPPSDFRIGVRSINRLPHDGIVSHHNTSSVLIAFS